MTSMQQDNEDDTMSIDLAFTDGEDYDSDEFDYTSSTSDDDDSMDFNFGDEMAVSDEPLYKSALVILIDD